MNKITNNINFTKIVKIIYKTHKLQQKIVFLCYKDTNKMCVINL